MCIHFTHVLFTCGHFVEIPTVGKDHIPPSYCERVKQELDWYHTQPDRKPEPVPYPPPRACPLIYGTTTFQGTTGVKTQDNPCANCVTMYGLTGVNALQIQRVEQRQKQSQSKRRKRWNKGKHPANHKWVWISSSGVWENGDRYNGVDKVRVRTTGQSGKNDGASPAPSKTQLNAESDYEATPSPLIQAEAGKGQVSSPEIAIASSPMALPELPQTAIESYVYAQEAGRRGIAMHMDYPDSRFPLRRDIMANSLLATPATTAPLDPSTLITGDYGFQVPMFAPVNGFYPSTAPQSYHEAPAVVYHGGFYPGPIWLPDGTVLEPDDDEEPFREAFASSIPAKAETLTPHVNRTEFPNQASSSPDVVPNPQSLEQHNAQCDSKLPSGSPRPIVRLSGIQKEDNTARRHSTTAVERKPPSTSLLIVSARRVSEGDSPATLSSEATFNH